MFEEFLQEERCTNLINIIEKDIVISNFFSGSSKETVSKKLQ